MKFKLGKSVVAIISALIGLVCNVNGQTERQLAEQALRDLNQKYYSSNQLAFQVSYRCRKNESSSAYIDSLRGEFKMSADKYWYKIDSIETIANNDTVLTLFREDQLMYLSKTSRQVRSNSPLAMLDSLFFNNPDYVFQISEDADEKMITVKSMAGQNFKDIEYHINKQSGFLNKIKTNVDASLLYDESVASKIDKASIYVVIEVLFSNYQSQSFDQSIFQSSNYFRHDGQQYTTVAPYQSYKIYLASPNL
jgi:hypothetical protein